MLNQEAKLIETIKKRRSTRKLIKKEGFKQDLILEILKESMLVPSAFNMQSYRIVALFGEKSDKLWDLIENKLFEKLGIEKFEKTRQKEKIQGFRGGNGTLVFFEDMAVVDEKGNIAKSYKDTFPSWSDQGSGIIQYAVWLLLTAEGYSASLQHYHQLIEEDIKKEWSLPPQWRLISQMPFGLNNEEIGVREFISFEEMVRVEK